MKAIMKEVSLEFEAPVIRCPICGMSFTVHFYNHTDEDENHGYLVSQVPDSGKPFYCPYCGGDVNENI